MTGRGPGRSASSADCPCISYRASSRSLQCRRRAWDAVANDVDGVAALWSIVGSVLDHVDIGNTSQRQLQRAALARPGQRLGLFGFQLERYGLADHGVLAVLFLGCLVDGENADIRQDDF